MIPRRSTLAALATAAVLGASGCGKLTGSRAGADGGASSGPFGFGALVDLVAFEGEIEFSIGISGLPTKTKMVFLAKGQKLAYEVGAPPSSTRIVMDGASKKMYVINDAAREYTASNMVVSATPAATATPKVTKTSRRDKVSGYECEIWDVTEGARTLEVCAARGMSFLGLGLAFGGLTGMNSEPAGWASAIGDAGYFPLRAVERAATGAEMWRYEVTRIEKKSVPEAKLSVPPGYVDKTVPVVPMPGARSGHPI
jgi:hypothetical protein